MIRRVLYVTGTRADFGIMLPVLKRMAGRSNFRVELAVTGMHLSQQHGSTVQEVRASGLPISAELQVPVDDDAPAVIASSAGQVAVGVAGLIEARRPDLCLVLGDRWEALATAMAATIACVPIAHVCGGERSGSIDDSMRHAISKLAQLHLVANAGARDRLIRLGESPSRIHVVGAPGLVGLRESATVPREAWAQSLRLDPSRTVALLLYHPVVQDAEAAGSQVQEILAAVRATDLQVVCLMPNADSGSARIRAMLEQAVKVDSRLRVLTHLPRPDFVSILATADLMIGNSSSGIVEAATFGTPVVNVGDRQSLRERNLNTIDCECDIESIASAIRRALSMGRQRITNIYGDGRADEYIAEALASLDPDQDFLKKRLPY